MATFSSDDASRLSFSPWSSRRNSAVDLSSSALIVVGVLVLTPPIGPAAAFRLVMLVLGGLAEDKDLVGDPLLITLPPSLGGAPPPALSKTVEVRVEAVVDVRAAVEDAMMGLKEDMEGGGTATLPYGPWLVSMVETMGVTTEEAGCMPAGGGGGGPPMAAAAAAAATMLGGMLSGTSPPGTAVMMRNLTTDGALCHHTFLCVCQLVDLWPPPTV